MRKKKIGALLMSACMVASLAACGGGDSGTTPTNTPEPTKGTEATPEPTKETEPTTGAENTPEPTKEADPEPTQEANVPQGDPVVIRYGTHWVQDLDPNHVDEVTGEYTMNETERQAGLAALAAVKEQLNVEFEFLQYSANTTEELMTSVLAGNPVCDLALMWGGSEGVILAQNVLQQLDNYAYIFEDEDTSWMFYDKLYGHNYMLTNVIRYKQRWPLIFNISMLEKVDALKDESGNLVTPMDHYLNGTWTWSTFTDYLTKVQAYYANTAAPDGSKYDTIQAYETDHRFAGLSAMYSAGGAIYGNAGLEPDSEASIKGMQYIEDLFEKKLLVDPGTYDDGKGTPEWTRAADDFGKGSTVFTDCPDWYIGGVAGSAADRGEIVGIVPWPREDSLSVDDPEYTQAITLGDSVGVLKGVSPEKTELALKAYALYWTTYYKALGGTDTVMEYKEKNALEELNKMKLDVLNEKYGDKIIECFLAIGDKLVNDYADLLGIRVTWDEIVGQSLYGLNGMSAYDVAVKANMNLFTNVTSNVESILASNDVHDNQPPTVDGKEAVFAAGTDLSSVNWAEYFTAKDSVDGELDMTKATYTVSEELDATKAGSYGDAVKAEISDAAGNKGEKKIKVIIYNPDNTTAPTVTAKEELPTVKMDTDTTTINWKDYIASAVDADGIDVSGTVAADLSELDTTTPGTYNVALTVTDYAGNTGSVTVPVTVEAAE